MQRTTRRVPSALKILCGVAIVTLALAFDPRQVVAADSVVGVWKVTEVNTTGANQASITTPQPGLLIFTKAHYSISRVTSPAQRAKVEPLKNPGAMTDAEKIARFEQWNVFQSNAGT